MVVVPLSNPAGNAPAEPVAVKPRTYEWLRVCASGSLLLGGVLLVTGKHRAGLLAAITGTGG